MVADAVGGKGEEGCNGSNGFKVGNLFDGGRSHTEPLGVATVTFDAEEG